MSVKLHPAVEEPLKMDSLLYGLNSVIDSEYKHSPLDLDQIRIVALEPGCPSDPLRCRILTHRRSDAPSYEAVSYTRDDDVLAGQIKILPSVPSISQTSFLWVPQSCASALRTLRNSSRPRYLWIDAICINQHDIRERSRHVRMMPKIYRSASQVVICLGDSDEHSAAIEFIARGRFKNTPPSTQFAIRQFFKHPWFSRHRVIQEVANARSAVVLCARAPPVPWSNFGLCARMLALDVPVMSPICRLRQRGWIDTITTEQFVKAVCEATACDCLDPRDRVFAFLAMYPTVMSTTQTEKYRRSGFAADGPQGGRVGDTSCSKGDAVGVEAESRLDEGEVANDGDQALNKMTNYAYSVDTVYRQFAKMLLKDLGLDFLSAVQGRAASEALPSWTPDWRLRRERTVLAHLPLTEFSAGGHWDGQSFRILPATDDASTDTLETTAICLGDIRHLGKSVDTDRPGWESVVFRDWKRIAQSARRVDRPKETTAGFLSAFVQTVMTDSDDEFVAVREILCRRLSMLRGEEHLASESLLEGLDAEAVTKLRISCHGRTLFVGSDGIIGLVASQSREGDFVAVLPGARLPYSFRCHDSFFAEVRLVGECFVHGMMRGESLVRGRFPKREIRIC